MRYLILLLLIYVNGYQMQAQTTNANDIVGKWMNNRNDEIIEITHSNDKYIGKVIWLKEPNDKYGIPKKDTNNPDEKLRSRQLLGLQVISGLEFINGKWQKGAIYSPERGGSINCELALKSINEISIKVSKGFFSSTKKWTRQ
jgi:uncharacterized protein (DUF2147 family)